MSGPPDDRSLAADLEHWFATGARDLPWRTDPRDPYRSLVSELMLQQTQVARVLEKFGPFVERFPTVRALAGAPEDAVLAAWAGLGYYRRARLLHACAKSIVADHGGVVPETLNELRALPGIGRYTAGAIASIVHGSRAAIVDGNVTRVLLRVHNKPAPQTGRDTVAWAWDRAGELVDASTDPGVFNEAMMELGATVCVPKGPRCPECPIREHCAAFAAGTTESVPPPKPRARQKPLFCASVIIEHKGTVLLQQRPPTGMWASMFQAPTVERDDRPPTREEIGDALGLKPESLESEGAFMHGTTHRAVKFTLYRCGDRPGNPDLIAQPVERLSEVALSNAQRRALTIAGILSPESRKPSR